ncbi:HlyD family type I secretion periplasmic adaptor subunit [Roseibium alexandrii]|uniref:HlyD family type I secretion periplasmic adaptor subunit n=1 Tax=Roseibium alexandrii TaxID=388408 RepID=UPI0037510D1E
MTTYPKSLEITSPTLHATILFTIAVFVATLVLSFVFKVEVVARGEGRVVPISRVQVVQSEFASRIVAIHVRNGSSVSEGDVLIELDPTEAMSDLGTIRAERDRLIIELSRIDAMVQSLGLELNEINILSKAQKFFVVPPKLEEHAFAIEQLELLRAEVADYLAFHGQITARENANRRSEAVTNANIDRVNAALEIQAERLGTSKQLLQNGTTSRSAFLNVQQVFTELERERDIHIRELEQKVAERAALDAERRHMTADLRSSLLERKAQIDGRLATLTEEERAAERRVLTARLVAPASGVVDRLTVFTVGGVAEAGAELLRIVPTLADVEIEGIFSNQDIGFMAVGQSANIRLDAYPSERFGFIRGTVSDIAADSTEVSEDQWAYVVRIKPDVAFLQVGADTFPVRPGMTATIDVTTDSRRIISYFFAPIFKTIQDAMGER